MKHGPLHSTVSSSNDLNDSSSLHHLCAEKTFSVSDSSSASATAADANFISLRLTTIQFDIDLSILEQNIAVCQQHSNEHHNLSC